MSPNEINAPTLDLGSLSDRVLVFGGPYSNLAATRAMQAQAEALGIPPERIICTGDIVAYCGEPAETLDTIRDWGIHVVMGNCEEALAASEPDCGCGFEPGSSCSVLAVGWYRYADRLVTTLQRHWMQSLPRSIAFELGGRRFRIVHGSLVQINEFVFASSDPQAKLAQLEKAGVDAIIGGHAGIPFGQQLGEQYWLNAGVIGMPANDGCPQVWYMLIDPIDKSLRVSWHPLEYDHAGSSASTVAAGMPEYGQALRDGLWPSMDILPAVERARRGQPLNLPAITIPICNSLANSA